MQAGRKMFISENGFILHQQQAGESSRLSEVPCLCLPEFEHKSCLMHA